MIIRICDIKPQGIVVEEEFSPEYIGLTEKDLLYFISPVSVTAHIQKMDLTVISEVTVEGRFRCQCYRTLEPVEQDWAREFHVDMEIDLDTEEVDLGEEIRQEIITRVPNRVLSEEGQKMIQEEKEEDDEERKTYQPFKNI